MKKFIQGRQQIYVGVQTLTLRVQGDYDVKSVVSATMCVNFLYESAIPETEDEPGCEEYFEMIDARLLVPLYLTNNSGITMSLDSRVDMLDILNNSQYSKLLECVSKPAGDSINWIEVL